MPQVSWSDTTNLLTVPATRSLASIRERILLHRPDWVVLRRRVDFDTTAYRVGPSPDEILDLTGSRVDPHMLFYAFSTTEVLDFATAHPDRLSLPIEEALELHEGMGSTVAIGRRPEQMDPIGGVGPSGLRIVQLDPRGRPMAVGVVEAPLAAEAPPASVPPVREVDLGPVRGVGGHTNGRGEGSEISAEPVDSAAPPPTAVGGTETSEVAVTLSAEADEELEVGAVGLVDFRLELAGEATPLRERLDVTIQEGEEIRILLTASGTAVEPVAPRLQTVPPPTAGHPVQGVFELQAIALGIAQVALIFRQGGSELGTIRFTIAVVEEVSGAARAASGAIAAPRDRADDETLVLLIEQRRSGDEIRYEYQLYSDDLGFNFLTLQSQPLQDRGGGAAATAIAYVEGIYRRVTEEVLSLDDVRRLSRKIRTLGTAMSRELLDPEVSRSLWPLRDRIRTVQVTSWEPYIPWELVRLRNPDTDEVDERFLCEYGLIRSFSGRSHPRTLHLDRWAYLAAQYPNGLEPAIGAEVEYFTHTLPDRGVQPASIPPEYDAFFDALETAEFDVLHIACHGESRHDRIEDAALILGDTLGPGGVPAPVTVDPTTVREEARLEQRQPLVFLNACESGRHGPSLTAWGGWPNAFLDAGAGAFVGTSWPVREKPASTFAGAFYDALLAGETLAAAASAARTATKDLGDASWLAFKVYGHPRARRPR